MAAKKVEDYKVLSAELAQVVTELEGGNLDIDEAVRCYERGLELVALLQAHLATAENHITELHESHLTTEEEE